MSGLRPEGAGVRRGTPCIRIGGATGAWGDSALSTGQLLEAGCDFIAYEALAEITMAILTRARRKDPALGYATDIVQMIADHLAEMLEGRVRVATNAGGVNPRAAAAVLRAAAQSRGLAVRVAVVEGDALTDRVPRLAAGGLRDMDRGEPLDPATASLHAYLGARPIAAAFDAGADVVITGRCADSALALGPLIHAFGWGPGDLDALSGGSLAGHLIECGVQSTGGVLTDWRDIASWEDLGYPIAECAPDGSFVLTKPAGTGGLVDVRSAAEQLVYEIGDPAAYVLPDLVCDWSGVTLTDLGGDRVRVEGARGRPPTPTLKASGLSFDGFKMTTLLLLAGREAVDKAHRLGRDLLRRAARVLERGGWSLLRGFDLEVLGAESTYGPYGRAQDAREVVLKLTLSHPERAALAAIARENASFGLAVPGVTGGGTGLPRPTPLIRLRSFLVPREQVAPTVSLDGAPVAFEPIPLSLARPLPPTVRTPETARFEPSDPVEVPLVAIAYARSGDKGPHANIGVVARHPDFLPALQAQLTAQVVAERFAHRAHPGQGRVERYLLPGIGALNFVLRDALGGGGVESLRFDPQGKAYAQQLLALRVAIPAAWLDHPALRA